MAAGRGTGVVKWWTRRASAAYRSLHRYRSAGEESWRVFKARQQNEDFIFRRMMEKARSV